MLQKNRKTPTDVTGDVIREISLKTVWAHAKAHRVTNIWSHLNWLLEKRIENFSSEHVAH
jgi:hypothetical protein